MEYGFIHDMLDVKLLVLYIMARVNYPVDLKKFMSWLIRTIR